jgi:ribonuclease Z
MNIWSLKIPYRSFPGLGGPARPLGPLALVLILAWPAGPAAGARADPPAREGLRRDQTGFTVTLLGTGNPRPSWERSGPATLIEAGGQRLLLDAGRGGATRLFQIGGADLLAGVETVLLTHLHSDHTVGLPDLWLTGWLFGRRVPLRVLGPPGTRSMMEGLDHAYEFDVRARRDMEEMLPGEGVSVEALDVMPGIVLDSGGLRVTAFPVDHRPVEPAYGYRVDFEGRSAVFSGDTRFAPAVAEQARGVDLLVHEVISPEIERRRAQVKDPAAIERIIARHTSPEEAGRLFAIARPRLAVFSHIVPSPARPRDLLPAARRTYRGRLEVGYDFMMIRIGDRIEVSRRRRLHDR